MLYANTDDGSSALWVCDGNGVVVDNISYSIGERAPILEQINEHYGTSFTGWSDNEISLRVGDTVPNWNAYEKILLPVNNNFRFKPSGNSAFIAGFVENDNAYIYTDSSNYLWNISPEGQIWGSFGAISDISTQAKQLLLNEYGKEFDVINALVENWEQGQTVPNWEGYKILE